MADPIEAPLSDGTVLRFPAGTPDHVVDAAVKRYMFNQRARQGATRQVNAALTMGPLGPVVAGVAPDIADRVNRVGNEAVNWLGTQFTKLGTGLLGANRDVGDLANAGQRWLGDKIGGHLGLAVKMTPNPHMPLDSVLRVFAPGVRDVVFPSSEALNKGIFGGLGVPETDDPGGLLGPAAPYVNMAVQGAAGGGLFGGLRTIVPGALGGLASEGAGQATKGAWYEPLARAGAGIGAGFLASVPGMMRNPSSSINRDTTGGRAPLPPVSTPAQTLSAEQASLAKATDTAHGQARWVEYRQPTPLPQRPFSADYPQGARADAAGRLTHDIEGRPLTADRVVGRRTVGGDDVAISPAEHVPFTTEVTGRSPEVVAPGKLPRGAVGLYEDSIDAATGERVRQIYLSRKLSQRQMPRILGHETGHAIDEIAGQIPTDGIIPELRRVYGALNAPNRRNSPPGLWGPEDLGYSAADVPRELMAEAIRAYLADPNYLKTVAPKVAARIREYVNAHPQLSRVVQFNSLLPPALGAGLLAPYLTDRADEAPARGLFDTAPR